MREKDPVQRISRRAIILIPPLALVGLCVGGAGASASVLIGGGLAWINFGLLKAGVNQALSRSGGRSPGLALVGFIGRLVLIFIGLFAIIQLSFLSLLWALLGLSVFVLAGILEALYLLIRGSA